MIKSLINQFFYAYHIERGRWHFHNYFRTLSFITDGCQVNAKEAEILCPVLLEYKNRAKHSVGKARLLKNEAKISQTA